ncbi:MAG: two pore domain potassium channel family protein [Actinobacteria bacterium]|nr:MAG: two pore domain potassium channel family protein [Actinomycetota bacterium]REK40583.1 MAG: two pore domain potassium channel family protein [Actinomycetota bacterium]
MWANPSGRTALIAVSGVFATGTVFYRIVEGWSWVDSFYFTVVTLTTVGYGDLAPTSAPSKLFTAFLILTGVGAILAFLDFLVSRTWERRRDQSG